MFTTSKLCSIFNIKLCKLRMWLNNDYVRYSVGSPGQGMKGYFDYKELLIAALFIYLIDELGMCRDNDKVITVALHYYPREFFVVDSIIYYNKEAGVWSNKTAVHMPKENKIVLTIPFYIIINKYLNDYKEQFYV